MANHKSTKKSIRKTQKKTEVNRLRRNSIRTFIKTIEAKIAEGSKSEALQAFKIAQKQIFKGVTAGVIKKETASRKISRLSQKIKVLEGEFKG